MSVSTSNLRLCRIIISVLLFTNTVVLVRAIRHLQSRDVSSAFDANANLTVTPNSLISNTLVGCMADQNDQVFQWFDQSNVMYSMSVKPDGFVKWMWPWQISCAWTTSTAYHCGNCGRIKFVSFDVLQDGICVVRLEPLSGKFLEAKVDKGTYFMTTPMNVVAVVCFRPDQPPSDAHSIDGLDSTTTLSEEPLATGQLLDLLVKTTRPPPAMITGYSSQSAVSKVDLVAPQGCMPDDNHQQVRFMVSDNIYAVNVPADGMQHDLSKTKPELQCLGYQASNNYNVGTCGSCWQQMDKIQITEGTACTIMLAKRQDGSDANPVTLSCGQWPIALPYAGWPVNISCSYS